MQTSVLSATSQNHRVVASATTTATALEKQVDPLALVLNVMCVRVLSCHIPVMLCGALCMYLVCALSSFPVGQAANTESN